MSRSGLIKAALEAAIEAGTVPHKVKASLDVWVSAPGRRVKLARADGTPTPNGLVWKKLPGSGPLPAPLDHTKDTIHQGRNQYIQDGPRRILVRRGDTITKLGRHYYAKRGNIQYLVTVPGILRKENSKSKGTPREVVHTAFFGDWGMPGGPIELPADTPQAEVNARLRAIVVEVLATRPQDENGRPILNEDSGVITLDPDGDDKWTFDSLGVVNEHGVPELRAILNRPLGSAFLIPPDVVAPWALTPAALLQSGERTCVPTQLTELSNGSLPYEEVCERLDRAFEALSKADKKVYNKKGWRDLGCTSILVMKYARMWRISCHVVHNGTTLHRFVPSERSHGDSLVFTISGDHAFFWRDPTVKMSFAFRDLGRKEPPPSKLVVLSDPPRTQGGRPWWPPAGGIQNGVHYETSQNLGLLRLHLEEEGIQTAARLNKRCAIVSLTLLESRAVIFPTASGLYRDLLEWQGLERMDPKFNYRSTDIGAVRRELHTVGQLPKVNLRSATSIKSLKLNNEAGTTIYSVPTNAEQLEAWGRHLQTLGLDVPYECESAASYAQRVVLAYLKPKRQPLEPGCREAVLAKTEGLCADCGDAAEELDHLIPVSDGGSNDPDNLQPLCRACHACRTMAQNLVPGELNPMASEFEPSVYEAFHKSAKAPQIVTTRATPTGKNTIWKGDKCSCRRSALDYCTDPFPIFSPLDTFQTAVPGDTSADFYFVDKGPLEWNEKTYWRHVGLYSGPRWYWRGAVEAALRFRVISWGDVKLSFKASAHAPPTLFKRIFEWIDETWGAIDPGVSSKGIVLPLVGLWNAPERAQWQCETVSHDDDCSFTGPVRRRALDVPDHEGVYHDIIFKTEMLSYTSMRPIGQIALDMEGVFLFRLKAALEPRLMHRSLIYPILGAKVDCLYVEVPRKLARDIGKILEREHIHPDGKPMYHWTQEATLDGKATPFIPSSHWPVVDEPLPVIEERPWENHTETEETTALELTRGLVGQGTSCFVCGPPGTGKSFILSQMARDLQQAGEKVAVVAFTNSVARQHSEVDVEPLWDSSVTKEQRVKMNKERLQKLRERSGQTIHHFLHSHKSFSGWILVDEASQVPLPLYAQLQRYKLSGAKFIFFGDFENQLGAAHDHWRGGRVPELALADSLALKGLSSFKRVVCTKPQRCDHELFGIYTNLPRLTVGDALVSLRRRFPRTPAQPQWDLCVSNAQRIKLNRERNARDSKAFEGPRLEVPMMADGHDAVLFEGVRLIGRKSHGKVVNGVLYEVASVSPVIIRELETDTTVELDMEQMKLLTLAGALTVFAAQGKTLPGRVRLWAGSRYTTMRTLVVGISRATRVDLVEVI